MVKNVKIDDEAHRRLSIAAAKIQAQKGDLCSALIRNALETLSEEQLKSLADQYHPPPDMSR